MTIDMWKIAEHANPNGTAILEVQWCAALQPVMIFLGSIPRFYMNECRYQTGLGPQKMKLWVWIVGTVSFLGALTIFGVCTGSLLEYIWDNGTPPDANMRLLDAQVLTALMLVQLGYPIVFLFSVVYMHLLPGGHRADGGSYPAWLSFCALSNTVSFLVNLLYFNPCLRVFQTKTWPTGRSTSPPRAVSRSTRPHAPCM